MKNYTHKTFGCVRVERPLSEEERAAVPDPSCRQDVWWWCVCTLCGDRTARPASRIAAAAKRPRNRWCRKCPRVPSARDAEIALLVAGGVSRSEVAARFGLKRARVGQIAADYRRHIAELAEKAAQREVRS